MLARFLPQDNRSFQSVSVPGHRRNVEVAGITRHGRGIH